MKTYLILAAQKEELDGLFSSLEYTKENVLDIEIYSSVKDDIKIYGLVSGIGKAGMAYTMGVFLAKYKVDYIINIGVAGSISSKLKKMETFISERVCYWDVDLTKFGHPLGEMSDCPLYFEADKELLEKARSLKNESVKYGLIISGDSFISKDNIKPEWFKQFDDPIACDMESATVGQIAYRNKIPFLIIRAISDDPRSEDDNKSVYEFNLEKAAYEAGKFTKEVIFNK